MIYKNMKKIDMKFIYKYLIQMKWMVDLNYMNKNKKYKY